MNVAPPPARSGPPSRTASSATSNPSSSSNVALSPAPPSTPSASTNNAVVSVAAPQQPPVSKADYMIVSSAHTSSNTTAVTAAPPQALHDVDLYTSLTKDLPHDAAVLQSVLYTHRSVANPDPTPDEVLERIDRDVGKWKSDAQEQAAASLELSLVQHRSELVEQQKDLMRRDVEHNRALRRMEDIIMNLERRIESDLNSDTGIGSIANQNNDTWVEMSARHKQQREQVSSLWAKKVLQAQERDFAAAEMDRLAHQGKTMLEEAASRAMLRNDEETARLQLRVMYGNETVKALLWTDVLADRRAVEQEEAVACSRAHEACSDDLRRVQRRIGAQEAIGMLLHHTDASEKGMRFNVTLEEQREWNELLSSLAKALLAADVASFAMYSQNTEEEEL